MEKIIIIYLKDNVKLTLPRDVHRVEIEDNFASFYNCNNDNEGNIVCTIPTENILYYYWVDENVCEAERKCETCRFYLITCDYVVGACDNNNKWEAKR